MADPDTPDSGKDDGARTLTQAELDRIIEERLARERKKYADYDELKAKAAKLDEYEAASKSDLEKAAEKAAAAEKRAEQAELKLLRYEVAFDKGLTPAQAKRLVGSSREELEADADEILEAFPTQGGVTPPPSRKPAAELQGGGDPTSGPLEMDPAKLAADLPRY